MHILNEDNYRYELKFLLTKKEAEILKHRLSMVMKKDTFSTNKNGEYYIRSLYYDDIYNTCYYEKLDGLYHRKKFRIRYYNFDETFITLELKGKIGSLSYKKRDIITKDEYNLINEKRYSDINYKKRKVLNEFVETIREKNIRPSIIVDYKRVAYTYSYEDVRITFDEDIASGRFNYDLFDKNMYLHKILKPEEVILEVKFNNKLPNLLNDIIKTVPMVKISISKFALCTERKFI